MFSTQLELFRKTNNTNTTMVAQSDTVFIDVPLEVYSENMKNSYAPGAIVQPQAPPQQTILYTTGVPTKRKRSRVKQVCGALCLTMIGLVLIILILIVLLIAFLIYFIYPREPTIDTEFGGLSNIQINSGSNTYRVTRDIKVDGIDLANLNVSLSAIALLNVTAYNPNYWTITVRSIKGTASSSGTLIGNLEYDNQVVALPLTLTQVSLPIRFQTLTYDREGLLALNDICTSNNNQIPLDVVADVDAWVYSLNRGLVVTIRKTILFDCSAIQQFLKTEVDIKTPTFNVRPSSFSNITRTGDIISGTAVINATSNNPNNFDIEVNNIAINLMRTGVSNEKIGSIAYAGTITLPQNKTSQFFIPAQFQSEPLSNKLKSSLITECFVSDSILVSVEASFQASALGYSQPMTSSYPYTLSCDTFLEYLQL
ncbi:1 TM domain-containing transmembrane protein [Acrasis kona]|uniref:1 TM domain-containing transmembrane protein n=1 Tax=Acrasis kona TaxID=1008807 RepID=A0AAW2Z0Z7_9EUKA